ncbi:MAG: M24 family metallopeptidase [Thermoplasmata archaeon]
MRQYAEGGLRVSEQSAEYIAADHSKRVKGLQERMAAEGLDAVVATTFENTLYYGGSYIMTIEALPNRLAMLLIPVDEDPTFLVCNIEESLVRSQSWVNDIRTYVEFAENPADALLTLLEERGLPGKRIGIEYRHLQAAYFRILQGASETTFCPADEILNRGRMVKSEDEIDVMTRIGMATIRAVESGYSHVNEGATERVLADAMCNHLYQEKAEEVSFLVLGAGQRCTGGHPLPTDYRLQRSDLIRVDIGGRLSHYRSDVARMAVVGNPTSKQERLYRNVCEAQRAIIDAMRPGREASTLYRICSNYLAGEGINLQSPHVGHALGLGLHEDPMLNPYDHTPLEPGMVFCVEPFFWDASGQVYHIEDLVLVTDDGAVVLTDVDGERRSLVYR